MAVQRADVTRDLRDAAAGDVAAADRAWATIYGDLRRLAHRRLRGEREGHTLSTTALVHEAYLKLARGHGVETSDRRHFMAVAARAMRQILVDYARGKSRAKRGGGTPLVTLDEGVHAALHPGRDPELFLALDEAVSKLAVDQPRLAEVVELRFFAGLTEREIAQLRDVSSRTVERDWRRARAYLYRLMGPDPEV